ncbi:MULTISPECIES: class I SAM-dependent methyltransferase [unclassified Modestobacter]|uniref:class I SAM-dependent methyltransferase n=1 Tax=unclassified Modestobacter TaxID=2643866 RepID=UPI0022AAF004|nr:MULTISPECIES: class I SAM-dependent methyltransferase [unclassified Modestobacter]MCZ2811449.1 class I SAM-dependent methyltransferase [Modestobacter sp. VKM Ac-2979]MCZ2840963.1 class I SAM-dependent methyltransferase [Modestobacter sp. VKM Ac-2980]MCZ2848247.1 class I SAM-dependent methyltransferase [Modestobacter sp. VKM Ac-2978]
MSDHTQRASLPPVRKAPRLAAGRARALGLPTRGTTNANRLRRVDRWLVATQVARLRDAARPLVVDLGYGASAVTTLELVDRLAPEVDRLEVVGLEIDPERVAAVADDRDPPRVDFRLGGFELAGLRPVLVRAFNVLRQYDEESAGRAWDTMRAALAPGGLLVEGTCDEWGRRATWVALDEDGPLTLTLAARVSDLERPSDLAERLPKALIHHNVPGQPVHAFLTAFDTAWASAAGLSTFGPRQRWAAAVESLADAGWPLVGPTRRWKHGEVSVRWSAVAPT